jgi:hypothetical protein
MGSAANAVVSASARVDAIEATTGFIMALELYTKTGEPSGSPVLDAA